jgi:hypothetical protein
MKLNWNFQNEFIGQFKYGTIYRDAIRGPRLDVCAIMGVTEKENVMVYHTMKLLNATAPSTLVHPCPYTVRTSLR